MGRSLIFMIVCLKHLWGGRSLVDQLLGIRLIAVEVIDDVETGVGALTYACFTLLGLRCRWRIVTLKRWGPIGLRPRQTEISEPLGRRLGGCLFAFRLVYWAWVLFVDAFEDG